jgi:predicted nucleic acid-binding protein
VIVVDTNLLAALLLDVPERPLAEAVFARDPRWAAPLLWRSELRNVLARSVRRSDLDVRAAEIRCARAQCLLAGREHSVDDAAVLRRAVSSGCTAYDCEFVVLADELCAPLVTFDRQVLAAFPATAIHPERFASGAFWGDRISEAVARLSPVASTAKRRRGAA